MMPDTHRRPVLKTRRNSRPGALRFWRSRNFGAALVARFLYASIAPFDGSAQAVAPGDFQEQTLGFHALALDQQIDVERGFQRFALPHTPYCVLRKLQTPAVQ